MTERLTKFLAVARIGMESDGSLNPEKHAIIAYLAADDKDPNLKSYRKHTSQVMKKGANKMQEGKRIHLTSEDYALYITVAKVPNHSHQLLAFFAIVDLNFGVAHTIGKLYDDFKGNFFKQVTSSQIMSAKANGAVHKKTQGLMRDICQKYGSNKIKKITKQVEEVKNIMNQNIDTALGNAAALDDIQTQAAALDDMAGSYLTNAKRTNRNMCMQAFKAKAIFAGVFLVLVGVIVGVILIMQS